MQRFDRPLPFGEILDRAITIVATTLSVTNSFATALSLTPTVIIDMLRGIEQHSAILSGGVRATT